MPKTRNSQRVATSALAHEDWARILPLEDSGDFQSRSQIVRIAARIGLGVLEDLDRDELDRLLAEDVRLQKRSTELDKSKAGPPLVREAKAKRRGWVE